MIQESTQSLNSICVFGNLKLLAQHYLRANVPKPAAFRSEYVLKLPLTGCKATTMISVPGIHDEFPGEVLLVRHPRHTVVGAECLLDLPADGPEEVLPLCFGGALEGGRERGEVAGEDWERFRGAGS